MDFEGSGKVWINIILSWSKKRMGRNGEGAGKWFIHLGKNFNSNHLMKHTMMINKSENGDESDVENVHMFYDLCLYYMLLRDAKK